MSLKIVHKGFLVLLVPLVVQVGFMVNSLRLQRQLEGLTERESRSKQILFHLNEVYSCSLDYAFLSIGMKIPGITIDSGTRKIEDLRRVIDSEFSSLSALIPPSSPQAQLLRSFNHERRRMLKLLSLMAATDEEYADGGMTFSFMQSTLPQLQQLQRCTTALQMSMYSLRDPERETTRQVAEDIKRTKDEMQLAAVCSIVLNIIVALVMAIIFGTHITRRVRVLVENSKRLGAGQSLLPPVGGSDEISLLDKSFHHASKTLDEVEQLKRDFYRMVAHDLRSPLSASLMSVQMVKTGDFGQLSQPIEKKLAIAERNLSSMIRLVNDILDMDKLQAGKMPLEIKPAEAKGIIDDALAAVQQLAEAKELTVAVEAEPASLECDPYRLTQCLINLCANAIKFSPKKTTITISCRTEGDFVEFAVSDQGRGIPEEALARIFEKFEQVQKSDALGLGTGLGLSICKLIVEAHSGKLMVNSVSGQGSTFSFKLPAKHVVI